MDQLLVDSHEAMPSQLMPLEPEETGAAELAELLLEDSALLDEPALLEESALEESALEEPAPEESALEEPALVLEAVDTGLVPTAMIFGRAGVTAVRDTSVFAVWAPLLVVTW